MKYRELREAMDHEADELAAFAQILVRELNLAATELAAALSRRDADAVAELKHKLKTSLQLLEAEGIGKDLGSIVQNLRAGEEPGTDLGRSSVDELRRLASELQEVRWE